MGTLEIPDSAMQAFVSQALVQTLTPEAREKLLVKAVENAITADYLAGDKKSLLQRAFEVAVDHEVRAQVKALLETDTMFKVRISEVVAAGVQNFMALDKGVLAEKISDTISKAFGSNRF